MKLKLLIGILVFLIIINLATLGSYLYFQFKRPDTAFRSPGRPPLPRLDLPAEQHQQLRELLSQLRQNTRSLHQQINTLRNEIYELIKKDSIPDNQINEKLKKIAAIRLEISQNAINNLIKAKAFLTPEQQRRFYNAFMRKHSHHKRFKHRDRRDKYWRRNSRYRQDVNWNLPHRWSGDHSSDHEDWHHSIPREPISLNPLF